MRSIVPVLLAAALVACTPVQQRWADGVGLTLAEASLACDWGGTRSAASRGWRDTMEGGTPARWVMGQAPGTGAVDAYFLITGLVLLDATRMVPLRWRPAVHAAVVAVEATAAWGNVETTGTACGFR